MPPGPSKNSPSPSVTPTPRFHRARQTPKNAAAPSVVGPARCMTRCGYLPDMPTGSMQSCLGGRRTPAATNSRGRIPVHAQEASGPFRPTAAPVGNRTRLPSPRPGPSRISLITGLASEERSASTSAHICPARAGGAPFSSLPTTDNRHIRRSRRCRIWVQHMPVAFSHLRSFRPFTCRPLPTRGRELCRGPLHCAVRILSRIAGPHGRRSN